MKIYLDNCCYGRQFDNHNIPQTKAEAEALTSIVNVCKAAKIKIVGSYVVVSELAKIKKSKLRAVIEEHYERTADTRILMINDDKARASALQAHGVGVMDSYHLAVAERGGVDFLLTTDADFERIVTKKNLSIVQIINPINFLPEIVKWLQ